jgi:hypothetical protein
MPLDQDPCSSAPAGVYALGYIGRYPEGGSDELAVATEPLPVCAGLKQFLHAGARCFAPAGEDQPA